MYSTNSTDFSPSNQATLRCAALRLSKVRSRRLLKLTRCCLHVCRQLEPALSSPLQTLYALISISLSLVFQETGPSSLRNQTVLFPSNRSVVTAHWGRHSGGEDFGIITREVLSFVRIKNEDFWYCTMWSTRALEAAQIGVLKSRRVMQLQVQIHGHIICFPECTQT